MPHQALTHCSQCLRMHQYWVVILNDYYQYIIIAQNDEVDIPNLYTDLILLTSQIEDIALKKVTVGRRKKETRGGKKEKSTLKVEKEMETKRGKREIHHEGRKRARKRGWRKKESSTMKGQEEWETMVNDYSTIQLLPRHTRSTDRLDVHNIPPGTGGMSSNLLTTPMYSPHLLETKGGREQKLREG